MKVKQKKEKHTPAKIQGIQIMSKKILQYYVSKFYHVTCII